MTEGSVCDAECLLTLQLERGTFVCLCLLVGACMYIYIYIYMHVHIHNENVCNGINVDTCKYLICNLWKDFVRTRRRPSQPRKVFDEHV